MPCRHHPWDGLGIDERLFDFHGLLQFLQAPGSLSGLESGLSPKDMLCDFHDLAGWLVAKVTLRVIELRHGAVQGCAFEQGFVMPSRIRIGDTACVVAHGLSHESPFRRDRFFQDILPHSETDHDVPFARSHPIAE